MKQVVQIKPLKLPPLKPLQEEGKTPFKQKPNGKARRRE